MVDDGLWLIIDVLNILILKEMVKESMQWRETAKSQPEPGICLELKTKVIISNNQAARDPASQQFKLIFIDPVLLVRPT